MNDYKKTEYWKRVQEFINADFHKGYDEALKTQIKKHRYEIRMIRALLKLRKANRKKPKVLK